MSAIVGIYYSDNKSVERENLGRMVDILAHRGSDKVGIWSEGSVGLGHRLLWTTPESLLEHFPLVNQTSDIVLTADARIDNRDELIKALDFSNRPPEKITDSQLILSAYEKWGEDCPEHLLGDFAFAIWDGPKQTLFCARDHFGVKPFYYFNSGREFIFATEIKALFCLPEVPRRLNEVRIAEHLASLDSDPASTFYQDILRLPPAHTLSVNQTEIRLQCYWSVDPSHELQLNSNEEYANQFRHIFTEAVRCRLRSAFPVGSMLSGGLDSSSITCVARQLLTAEGDNKLHTFSARFDKVTQSDERSFQDAVLAQNNFQPHYLYGDERGPLTDLDRVLWHLDEALDSGNLYLNWGLYGFAKEHGVRVILDGFDGDTTVSHGNEYLRELAYKGKWLTLAIETRAYGRRFNLPWKKVLWNWIWRYGITPTIVQFLKPLKPIYRILHPPQHINSKPMWSAPLNSDFVQRIGLAERCMANTIDPPQTEKENHYRLLTRNVMSQILEVLDRTAGAFSTELRFPFFDKRLVEFCLSLPSNQKLHQGWGRVVMRRAMTDILPKEVQWRVTKSNLHPSFEHGLLAFEREHLEEVILKDPGAIEEYLDIATLRQAYHRFVSREATEEEVNLLWRTVSLALWLRRMGLTPQSLPVIQKEVTPIKN